MTRPAATQLREGEDGTMVLQPDHVVAPPYLIPGMKPSVPAFLHALLVGTEKQMECLPLHAVQEGT